MLPTKFYSRRAACRRGFTLVEVMIGATISTVILAGVLASFLMLGRTGYNAANYSVMETEARRALENFSLEARMASNIAWSSSSAITFTVVTDTGTYKVTFAYDSSTSGATAQSFYRQLGEYATSNTNPKLVLVRGVSEFAYRRYKVVKTITDPVTGATQMLAEPAANNLETKQIQLTLRSVRTGQTTVATTNAVLSARVVLRNKDVTT